MSPLELANQFMDIFYSGNRLERLSELLCNDFEFEGPFYQFHSAKDYIDSLRESPPQNMDYHVLQSYESENRACLIYAFRKPGVSTMMAQHFETKNQRISKTILIFDRKAFD